MFQNQINILFDITEITRQLCIIDQRNFSFIPEEDYNDYIVKKEIPDEYMQAYEWAFSK